MWNQWILMRSARRNETGIFYETSPRIKILTLSDFCKPLRKPSKPNVPQDCFARRETTRCRWTVKCRNRVSFELAIVHPILSAIRLTACFDFTRYLWFLLCDVSLSFGKDSLFDQFCCNNQTLSRSAPINLFWIDHYWSFRGMCSLCKLASFQQPSHLIAIWLCLIQNFWIFVFGLQYLGSSWGRHEFTVKYRY